MRYTPSPVPHEAQRIAEFLRRELQRISGAFIEDTPVVQYRTRFADASLSAGVSANWKVAAGNVIRLSASTTLTLTGLVLMNVGTGVVVLLSENAASSASSRFALPTTWQLSANAAAVLWYDPVSFRFRGVSRT
jgi:uncharacterized protein YjeT (DUF2065 family)